MYNYLKYIEASISCDGDLIQIEHTECTPRLVSMWYAIKLDSGTYRIGLHISPSGKKRIGMYLYPLGGYDKIFKVSSDIEDEVIIEPLLTDTSDVKVEDVYQYLVDIKKVVDSVKANKKSIFHLEKDMQKYSEELAKKTTQEERT